MVDRAKARADYAALAGNEFIAFYLEELAERHRQELQVLATTADMPDIYRSQGRAEMLQMIPHLFDDCVKKLTK